MTECQECARLRAELAQRADLYLSRECAKLRAEVVLLQREDTLNRLAIDDLHKSYKEQLRFLDKDRGSEMTTCPGCQRRDADIHRLRIIIEDVARQSFSEWPEALQERLRAIINSDLGCDEDKPSPGDFADAEYSGL